MPTQLQDRLVSLSYLSKPELFEIWAQLFKTKPHCQMRKDLLIRILAFRIQEDASGITRETNTKELTQISRKLCSETAIRDCQTSVFKPGTRLIRQWEGETHVVHVGNSEFEYRGTSHQSLSEIARLITGTRWSGPLFFGLKFNKAEGKQRTL